MTELDPQRIFSLSVDGQPLPAEGFNQYFNNQGRPFEALGKLLVEAAPHDNDIDSYIATSNTFRSVISPPPTPQEVTVFATSQSGTIATVNVLPAIEKGIKI